MKTENRVWLTLKDVYGQTPDPKIVIALGDCAVNCGVFKGSYAVTGPVDRHIPVDVRISGCPHLRQRLSRPLKIYEGS
jgi:Ni,Fe-hydrogenase III small subunit